MDLELGPEADDEVAAAMSLAAALVGLDPRARVAGDPGRWWRAGLDDAVERAPGTEEAQPSYEAAPLPSYEAAPSPRSTRGATRA